MRYSLTPATRLILRHPLRFMWRVVRAFHANQGLLLSGALSYYTLLSIIPFFTLVLIALSHLVDDTVLLRYLEQQLRIVIPGLTETLLNQAIMFLERRYVAGWIGILVMLFFSSLAFTVLENTIAIIFRRQRAVRRHFMVSAIMPYAYIMLMGIGLMLISFIGGLLHSMEGGKLIILFWHMDLSGVTGIGLYLVGFGGMLVMLTSFYMVMPFGKVALRHALVGGLTAVILWEIARRGLVWYFSTLSMVNVVYGSLTTVIVALLSLEVAGVILLLGAQVVAEYEYLYAGGRLADPIQPLGARSRP